MVNDRSELDVVFLNNPVGVVFDLRTADGTVDVRGILILILILL